MPAERRQVVSRITSPANGASVRPSRRRTTALPSATAVSAATPTPTSSVDFGRSARSSAAFTRGLDDNAAHNATAGNTHNRNLSSTGFGGTGATTTTTTTAVHHRSRPSISRAARPQSVYQIVEAYRPLAYSIEKAEQEAKAAAVADEKRRSLVLSPLQTAMMMTPTTTTTTAQPVPFPEDDAMDIDEFGQFSPATPTTAPPVTPSNHNQFEDDDFAVLRSPTRGKQQEECISGRGMLKRGYHIILDTPLENTEEARWAAIKRMEAQLRELDKSFTRVAPPSRNRRITNVTNHAPTAVAPSAASFSAANRAAWNI
jgi:hypothetical protein